MYAYGFLFPAQRIVKELKLEHQYSINLLFARSKYRADRKDRELGDKRYVHISVHVPVYCQQS